MDKNGKATTNLRSFVVVPSSWHGPLVVARNKRYLRHEDGSSFYGTGFWYNDGYSGFNSGQVKPDMLDNLKKLGVSYRHVHYSPGNAGQRPGPV